MAQRKQKIKRYRYVGNVRQSIWRRIGRLLLFLLLGAALFGLGWMVASKGVDAITRFWYDGLAVTDQTEQDEPEVTPEKSESQSEPEEETVAASEEARADLTQPKQGDTSGEFAQIALSSLNSEDTLRVALQSAKLAGADRALLTVKDERGYIYYSSGIALAQTAGAVRSGADLEMFVRVCAEENIIPCVRIYVFRDPLAVYADRTMAVCYRQEGVTWLDNYQDQGGQPWLNPYNVAARQYAVDIARELMQSGIQEIVFAGVQFPEGYSLDNCYFGEAVATISRTDCLAECVSMLQDAVGDGTAWFEYSAVQAFQPDAYVVGEKGVQSLGADRLLLTVSSFWSSEGQLILPECDSSAMQSWVEQARENGCRYFALDYSALLADPVTAESWKTTAADAGFTFFKQS